MLLSGNRKRRYHPTLPSKRDCGRRPQREKTLMNCFRRKDSTSFAAKTRGCSGKLRSSSRPWTGRASRSTSLRSLPKTFKGRSRVCRPARRSLRQPRPSKRPSRRASRSVSEFKAAGGERFRRSVQSNFEQRQSQAGYTQRGLCVAEGLLQKGSSNPASAIRTSHRLRAQVRKP